MGTTPNQTVRHFLPWLGLAGALAVVLGAFRFLLGHRYSPETYIVLPIIPYGVEVVWCGLVALGVIVVLVKLRRDEQAARDSLQAILPAAAYSCVVLLKTMTGIPIQFYDIILFSVALGWAAAHRVRKRARASVADPASESASARWAGLIVWMAVGLLGAYYYLQQVHYLDNLALGYADCGEYARLMFNTVSNPHDLFLRVNPDKPLFYDHFHPGILPLTPLWWLLPDIKLTIVLQLIGIVGAAIPIYWLGNLILKDRTAALLLALCWLAYPPVTQIIYGGSYGFHWSSLGLLLIFIALGLWRKGRPGWALAAAAWALLLKEEAAIPIGMFGIYLALFEQRRWAGAAIAVTAFAYFLLVTSIVIPAMSGAGYQGQRYFSDLGATKWEILLSPLSKPQVFWGQLLSPSSLYFAALLLAPVLFVPFRRPSLLLAGSLVFLFDCLHPTLKNICFQYQTTLLPVVFWAFVETLRDDDTQKRRALLIGSLAASVTLSIFTGNTFWSKETIPTRLCPGRLGVVRQVARDVDLNGSLFATQRVAAHFVRQKYLYVEPPLPPSIDYVLLDLRDSWRVVGGMDWLERIRVLQRQAENNPDLHLVRAEDGIVLYARRGPPLDAQALVERDSLPSNAIRQRTSLGDSVRIEGFTIGIAPSGKKDGMDVATIRTFATVDTPTHTDRAAKCLIRFGAADADAESFGSDIQPLGQSVWPTVRWSPGKFHEDSFIIPFPEDVRTDKVSVTFEGAGIP